MEEKFRSTATNGWVANSLGISNSMASRIRSGDRFPSVLLMTRIQSVLGWKMSAQAKVFNTPAYAEGFERAIERHRARSREEVAS